MKIFSFELVLLQPVRIANIDTSKIGETDTISYIPGSTIRGAVMSHLSDALGNAANKQLLLSDKVRFFNAYPVIEENKEKKQLYPSLMGFYENKQATGDLENIFAVENPTSGNKRASLGTFCMIDTADGECTIKYTAVKKADMLNIAVAEKKIFRGVSLKSGQVFRGYITADENASSYINGALSCREMIIGSLKTSGYGRCRIQNVKEIADLPTPFDIPPSPVKAAYMIALSPLAMRNSYGEICGIDEEQLSKRMGGVEVEIQKCATSVIRVSGINRTWGCRTPEITMYKPGSVFKLVFSREVPSEKLKAIADSGLGVNLAEGCGWVCFSDSRDFESIKKKAEILAQMPKMEGVEIEALSVEGQEIAEQKKEIAKKIAQKKIQDAMYEYVIDPKNEIKGYKQGKSQYGIALKLVKSLQYACGNEDAVVNTIQNYIKHEEEKLGKDKQQSTDDSQKRRMLDMLKEIVVGKHGDLLKKLSLDSLKLMKDKIDINDLFDDTEKCKLSAKLLEMRITYAGRKEEP